MSKIKVKEIIDWLQTEYSENEAVEQVTNASIETIKVTVITFDNGVKNWIYKDKKGNIKQLKKL